MIVPINKHILIEPVKRDSFITSSRETYQEIGVVIAIYESDKEFQPNFGVGDKVLFDGWLAKKYPKEESDDFYWLVKVDDIAAYESVSK